ncbi:MAG: DUF4185 domain-containing protein [Acholeplasmatales bacterium]|nr:MAG: DUF4185 domain-containing protein [Acholeplasmatales bacterium]
MRKGMVCMLMLTTWWVLLSCRDDAPPPQTGLEIVLEAVEPCTVHPARTAGDTVVVKSLRIDDAVVTGDPDAFIHPCKATTQNPLAVSEGIRNTFIMEFQFDGIYPLADMDLTNWLGEGDYALQAISVDVSIEPRGFSRVVQQLPLDAQTTRVPINRAARYVRIVFSTQPGTGNTGGEYFGLNAVRFTLGSGKIVLEEDDLSHAFRRYEGWSGADGIFSFNLTDGRTHIGADFERLLFIFSDTFIGPSGTHNHVRQTMRLINNTLGYYTPAETFSEGLEFVYAGTEALPRNLFEPDYYIGYHASNLSDFDGFDRTDSPQARLDNRALGAMWRSTMQTDISLSFSLHERLPLGAAYLWNDNVDPSFGIQTFELLAKTEHGEFESLGVYTLPQATTDAPTPYQLAIDLEGVETESLKIIPFDNYESTFTHFALGKVMFTGEEGRVLHAQSAATDSLFGRDATENSARLWLQDGVVIGDVFYNFPIVVKDSPDLFKVHQVGLSRVPIVAGELMTTETAYFTTPLQARTADGGELFFGAGVMNLSTHQDLDDPYVYVYGYLDFDGRHLTVARVLPEQFENFNAWTFYDGNTFQPDIHLSAPLIKGVSAELSVSYVPEGPYEGRYVLTVMENTLSGRVSVAYAETPYGPFSAFELLYRTQEHQQFNNTFTYNAKMHPLLSTANEWIISYNVNATTNFALRDVRIYHPRFIRVILVP